MIRYVNIPAEAEVIPGSPAFAFFDTVTDRFVELAGSQVWANWHDFAQDFEADPPNSCQPIDRFRNLLPPELRQRHI
jgi:hypothetical protein